MSSIHTTALLLGTFDVLHPGHIRLFKISKDIADEVIVGLNTDSFVLQYKGKEPIMGLEERIEMISSCRYVDRVEVNEGGYNSRLIIERLMPDFVIHGDDWTGDSYLKQLNVTNDWLVSKGIKVLYVPYDTGTKKISSTLIKQRIKLS